MPKLTLDEQLMNETQLIYKWLKEGRISCEQLVREYANTIRAERDAYAYEATSYTYPLYLYTNKGELDKDSKWIKDKAIGMLYTFNNQRNGIKFKETFEKYVDKEKLNTDIDSIQYCIYKEDKGE